MLHPQERSDLPSKLEALKCLFLNEDAGRAAAATATLSDE